MIKKLLIALLFILVFLIRVVPYWHYAVKDGGVWFADPDSCYHLRRIELTAQHFPQLQVIDNFSGYSENHIIWAPIYDWCLAGIWFILSFAGISKAAILFILAFINPVLALLNSYLVYRLFLMIYANKNLAVACALLFSIFPKNIIYSSFANCDHHAAEVLGMTFLFYRLLLLIERPGLKSILFYSSAIVLATLIWAGSIFFVFCSVLVVFANDLRKKTITLKALGISLCRSVIFIVPFACYYVLRGSPLNDFYSFSLFQPSVYLILSMLIFAYLRGLRKQERTLVLCEVYIEYLSYLGGMLALICSIPQIRNGIKYLWRKQPTFMSFVSESESIFKMQGTWTYSVVFLYLSFFIVLLPLFYVILMKHRDQISESGYYFLMVITPIYFVLICLQKRYSYHFSLPFSVVLSINFYFCYEFLRTKFAKILVLIIIIVVLLAGFYPMHPVLSFGNDNLYAELSSLFPALAYLTYNAPDIPDNFNGKGLPGYFVLSEWNLGHWIQFYAHKPVIADNFGKESHMQIIANILLCYSEKEAYELLTKYRVKYIIVRDYKATLYYLPLLKGYYPEQYWESFLDKNGKYYVSPVGGLTFGFKLCELPDIFSQNDSPLKGKIILAKEWEDRHRALYRDGLNGKIRLYEVKW